MAGCAHRGTILSVRQSPLYVCPPADGRRQAASRILGFVLSCDLQNGAHKTCLLYVKHPHINVQMLQISDGEQAGSFIFLDHQPALVEPWWESPLEKAEGWVWVEGGRGDEEMVDYSCFWPVESYLTRSCEEYWSHCFSDCVTQQWELSATLVMPVENTSCGNKK